MSLYLLPYSYRSGPSFLESVLNDLDRMEMAMRPALESVCPASCKGDKSGQLEKVEDDESKLAISLNVGKFKPEELSVDLDGRVLKIEGKQEIKEKNGYTMRTFVRQWLLPENIDLEQMKSNITEDGHLSIEAPKITKKSPHARSIKIEKAAPAVKEK
ncbi:Hsp20/alpha crystallin family protein [Oesophagostomum dentatum]|uniref:Hsp20/alpha crystallin family protein n=1 Tax=Oesophagostomum dentatum TaxID=61180 RepID=A0A0B1S6M8_OESDE|nr:Hsp20/alpha crystallin family protein [Oesophagostomum dentatum]